MQFYSAKVGTTTFEVPIHYKLVRPVGSGAYGVVVSAVDERTGKKVAIKKVQLEDTLGLKLGSEGWHPTAAYDPTPRCLLCA
jgi:hypothetical protein